MYLLPQPKEVQELKGSYDVDYRRRIVIDSACGENVFLYAKMLSETLEKWAGLTVPVVKGRAAAGDMLLKISAEAGKGNAGDRGYELQIKEESVYVSGSDEEFLLYGIQTLRQICIQSGGVLPCVIIRDCPDMPNRGFYHDMTRGRVAHLSELKKLVDKMSLYKLNQLQLYVEHTYLFEDFSEMWRDETPLTADEIMELDDYCAKRHVELVPSLATFGHMYKLLRTSEYEECCELEDRIQGFGFNQRMAHHTVNVSNRKGIETVKKMIAEYMQLFRSKYFNICADETFDLCKGRSAHMLKDRDVNDIYTDYVRELSEFLIENGRTPMYWGDILWNSPEKIKALPEQNICLNWGYAATQREDETRKIAEANAVQYTCPGVGGWNEWMNLFENCYENIKRMCTYAMKYKAVGVLNTDWGDFGHVNQPEFSRPGMIYGAAFSWNADILPFEEINKRISVLEYADSTGRVMEILSGVASCQSFGWREAVVYREIELLGEPAEDQNELFMKGAPEKAEENSRKLQAIRQELQKTFAKADTAEKYMLQKYLIGIDGILVWNRVKAVLGKQLYQIDCSKEDPKQVAADLENWFMRYKDEWRKVSKEGDLGYVSDIIFWYADLLRSGAAAK